MRDFIPAEAFPPGRLLRKEPAARGWTQGEFARILGRPAQLVSELVNEIMRGRRLTTEQTAAKIGAALGTSALVWFNLETGLSALEVAPGKEA